MWDIFWIFSICRIDIGLKFIPSQLKLFRCIPISVSEPIRIIPNQSEKRFVSRLMKNVQKSIRLNPKNSETSIRMNPSEYELGLIQTKFSIRIWSDVSELIGLSRMEFWLFFIKRDTKRFSDWFGMIRIGSDTDIGMNRNSSDRLGNNFNPIFSPRHCPGDSFGLELIPSLSVLFRFIPISVSEPIR